MSIIGYDWYEIISLYGRQSLINIEGTCNNGTFRLGVHKDSISVLQFVQFLGQMERPKFQPPSAYRTEK